MTALRVLVVDDSRTARQMLSGIIGYTSDMQVIAEASDGIEALAFTQKYRPDVILMDIVMPGLDGLAATRQIMSSCPTPIVLVTASMESYETDIAFKAIRAGALTVLQKPAGVANNGDVQIIINTVRAMAKVQVIHHYGSRQAAVQLPSEDEIPEQFIEEMPAPQLVAMVASTGGPAALSEIIRQLPGDFPLPVVIVQHIAPDFVESLRAWFDGLTPLSVKIAGTGQRPARGHIYLAPGDAHLTFTANLTFRMDQTPNLSAHMPSGDVLLESVARTYGKRAIGIVLTGMGEDGAQGLKAMYDRGAFTIAQDEATSVVFGMPAEAIQRNAVRQVLPVTEIVPSLMQLMQQTS